MPISSSYRCAGSLIAFAWLVSGMATAAPIERTRVDVPVTEATNMSLALSPDRKNIAIDLMGNLWTLAAQGGEATRITDVAMEARYPQWSPDGERLVFQCYRNGRWQLCITDRDQKLLQLTADPYDHREPGFSPDGRCVVYVSDEGGNYDVWEADVASGERHRITQTSADEAYPVWSPKGDQLAYLVVEGKTTHLAVRANGQERRLTSVDGSKRLVLPSWHPSSTAITYVEYDATAKTSALHWIEVATGERRQLTDAGEDVFATRTTWFDDKTFLYGADGAIRKRDMKGGRPTRIAFKATFPVERHRYAHRKLAALEEGDRPTLGILRPHVSPDGKNVAFAALGDLWLLEIGKPEPQRLTDDTAVESDPTFSPDGRLVVFTSDRRESGTMDLWAIDLHSGERRLLASPGESITLPGFSPDGRYIAYLIANQADWHDRFVHIFDVQSLQARKLPQPYFHPSRPTWSADGKTIAMSVMRPSATRFRRGLNEIQLVDLASFASKVVEPIAGRSLAMRGANGPEWSPDGAQMAFVADGVLWSVPVSNSGELRGPALRLTNEIVDSISWTQDSRYIVYVSNGRLRRLDIYSGENAPIPLALTWRNREPSGRIVVRAGRLFDAVTSEYRRNVDIVIDGRRITSVQPARQNWAGDVRVIDASNQTVIPGLIESHIHNFPMNGEATGRLLLSFGVTSIREVGTDPYDGLESRESWASGARPGPRNFYTGLLEGGRVYYPLSLAIDSPAHFNLELERAAALDYDLVKTYDHLPDSQVARTVEFAHQRGITVTSHNLWPAAAFGADGVEHLTTFGRRDFSDRQSFGGKIYGDVIALLRESGIGIGTTAFVFDPNLERPPGNDRWKPSDLIQISNLLPARYRQQLDAFTARASAMTPAQKAQQRASASVSEKIVVKLHANGVKVIPSTDTSFYMDGLSLIREMIGVHTAGLSMADVLSATTRDAANVLGVSADLGTIEAGKLADLVILDGDPLARPSDLLNVSVVMKDGIAHTQADLAARGDRTSRLAPASRE